MTQPSSPSPTATYRLQLQPDFPFAAAERAVPHLAALGISHLHLSPVLEAVPGSTHGYDVVDHTAVRAELGGETGLRALAATARAHGLGLVVDLVPNHMAVPEPMSLNGPLWQVLRDGPASPYARWFDIDWGAAHGGRLLLPVLGGRIGEERRHFRVEGEVLRYHGHAFPLRPGTEKLPPDRLLEAQWYRLAWWRLARSELNYRRFFTISELIGVRVEDPEVFEATHGTVLRLMAEGVIDGLRIDHPDGLVDPGGYLARLHERTGGRWTVVEKILTGDERLPDSWACAGTTGYDALRHIDGLFVCPQGAGRLFSHYRDFVTPLADEGGDWEETVRRAAYEVVTHDLATEIERLVRTAARISARAPGPGDHATWALRHALRELLVRLPVYRPYAADPTRADQDAAMLDAAAAQARTAFRVPEEARAVDLLRDLALGRLTDPRSTTARTAPTSRRGSRRPRPRCTPNPWRTPPSTAIRYCCRPARSAAIRGAGARPGGVPCVLRPAPAGPPGVRHRALHPRHQAQRRCTGADRGAVGVPGPVAGCARGDGRRRGVRPHGERGGRDRPGGPDGVVAGLADRVRPGCGR